MRGPLIVTCSSRGQEVRRSDNHETRKPRRRRTRKPPPPETSWAWFFDIDGTLVELAQVPSGIVLDDEMAAIIERLRSLSGGAVALVTGRKIEEVDRLLPLDALPIAGQHGFELRRDADLIMDDPHQFDALSEICARLEKESERHPGLMLERKNPCIALHYRARPRLGGYANRVMRLLRDKYAPSYKIQRGKLVVELRPSGTNKGVAVREFMSQAPFAGRRPVFVGDDLTDEAAFNVVNEMGGVSIKIGPGKTEAEFRLSGLSDLRDWLASGIETERVLLAGHGATDG